MKTIALVITIFLLTIVTAFSEQTQLMVYMNNGDILKGTLYKDVPDNYLQLEMKDGSIRMLKYSDIQKKVIVNQNADSGTQDSTKLDPKTGIWKYFHKGFDFNINVFDFDYKEDVPLPLKSTENGLIKGADFGIYSCKDRPFLVSLLLGYAKAEEDYDGSTQTGVPVKAKTISSFFRLRLTAEYKFDVDEIIKFVPFVGYDMRIWDREISNSLEEVYSWQNLITGAYLDFQLNDDVNLIFSGQLNNMYNGDINILFSKINTEYPNIILTLGNVTAYECSATFKMKVDETIDFLINAYYENYGFEKSNYYYENGEPVLYEPSSTTYILGVRAGLSLSF